MNNTNTTKKQYKYDVFISYKHAPLDMLIASTLQKSLEHYKLSKEIQKKTGKKKLKRVFRDKEELAVGSDLNAEIDEQLENSEFLVILCSKASKQSPWVNRELKMFLEDHDIMHVLPVIIDGEPNEVYPDLLLQYGEPFALDVRGENDRDSLRKLKKDLPKLMAPILYCSYDELIQRQKRYQMQRFGIFASIVALVLLGFSGYALFQNRKLEKAHQQTLRESSKVLVEQARIALEEGDRITSMEYLLQALPKDGEDFPIPPQLQYYLTEAVGYYQDSSYSHAQLTRLQKNVNEDGEDELITDQDGAYVLTKSKKTLSVWDGKTLKRVQEITIPSQYSQIKKICQEDLCGENRILLYADDFVYLYDYLSGKQLWKTHFSKDVQKIIYLPASETIYVFLPHSVYSLDSKTGHKKNGIKLNLPDQYEITDQSEAGVLPASSENKYPIYYFVASEKGEDTGHKRILSFNEHTSELEEIAPELECNLNLEDAYDKFVLSNKILYYTSLNIQDKIVTLTAYDTKDKKMLWQKDYPYQGNSSSDLWIYRLENSDKEIIFFYVGRSFITVNPQNGETLRSTVMDDGNIVKTFPATGNRVRILTSSGAATDCDLDKNLLISFGLHFTDMVNITWEDSCYFVLTDDHHIARYENANNTENIKPYLEVENSTYIKDIFQDQGYLIINGGNTYYCRKLDEENVTENTDSAEKQSLPFEKIDLSEIGYSFDISYKGIQDDKMIFYYDDYADNPEYIVYDLKKKTLDRETIDFSLGDQSIFFLSTTATDHFCFYAHSNNLKGKLYIYDRVEKTVSSFVYGSEENVDGLIASPDSKRVLIYDSYSQNLKLLDIDKKQCLQKISLADWDESLLKPLIQWTSDSKHFLMTNQENIYVYDCDGQEVAKIPYDNHNNSTKVDCPFITLSPNADFLYYVYNGKLYQVSLKTKTIINEESLPDSFQKNYEKDEYHNLSFEFDSDQNLYIYNDDAKREILKIQTDVTNFGKLYQVNNAYFYEENQHRFYLSEILSDQVDYIDEISFEEVIEKAKKILDFPENDVEEMSSTQSNGYSAEKSSGNSKGSSSAASDEWTSYHRILIQDRPGISAKDSKRNADILQKSLDFLPKDANATLEKTEDRLILSIPKSFCDSKNIVKELLVYLTKPMNYVLQSENESTDSSNLDFSETGTEAEDHTSDDSSNPESEPLALLPEDILSVGHGQGDLPKLSSIDNDSVKDSYYFRFQFTDSFIEKMKERLGSQNSDEICFVDNDSSNEEIDYYDILPDLTLHKGDDGFYYSFYEDLDLMYGFEDYFEYMFTRERLSRSYIYHYMIDITWEEEEESFGEYQCNVEDLPENSCYFQYSSFSFITKNQLESNKNVIKARLDAFEIPYAFGYNQGEGIAFRMASNPFSEIQMRNCILSSPYCYLNCGTQEVYGYCDGILEWMEDAQKYKLRPNDTMNKQVKEWASKGTGTIYFSFGEENNAIASLECKEITNVDELLFTPLPIGKKQHAFYQEIIMNPEIEGFFDFDYCE